MPAIPYTRGPWVAAKHPAIDSSEPWQIIAADVPHPGRRFTSMPIAVLDRVVGGPEETANAMLLAASPELLEKVESLLTQTCGKPGAEYFRDNDHTRALIRELREIVAKAKFVPVSA